MNYTYEEIIFKAANYIYIGDNNDDYDKGELSGAAFVIARMFNKSKIEVKEDIKKKQKDII